MLASQADPRIAIGRNHIEEVEAFGDGVDADFVRGRLRARTDVLMPLTRPRPLSS